MRRDETPGRIVTNLCTCVGVHDVITCADLYYDRLRCVGVVVGQILGFSIDLLRRPYNTLALPCECVIVSYHTGQFVGYWFTLFQLLLFTRIFFLAIVVIYARKQRGRRWSTATVAAIILRLKKRAKFAGTNLDIFFGRQPVRDYDDDDDVMSTLSKIMCIFNFPYSFNF